MKLLADNNYSIKSFYENGKLEGELLILDKDNNVVSGEFYKSGVLQHIISPDSVKKKKEK